MRFPFSTRLFPKPSIVYPILGNHTNVIHDLCLSGAPLTYSDFTGMSMPRSNFSGAKLGHAKLINAELCYANLSGADLNSADLTNADLSNADLRGAILHGTNLTGADLSGANITDADLSYARLDNAILYDTIGYAMACPADSGYVAWKCCRSYWHLYKHDLVYVKLYIPADARRSSATSRKCRAEYAEVIGIYDANKRLLPIQHAFSMFDREFEYTVKTQVWASSWDDDRWQECAPGIHHFMTFDEAVQYGHI